MIQASENPCSTPQPAQTANQEQLPTFVLVTPTKNEEETIGETIKSVLRQTRKPAEWVIVSDGSTDGTERIVRAAMEHHAWIKLIALSPRADRNFAAVVRATEIGVGRLETRDYRYIGLLDSDVRFQADYFEQVLAEFAKAPNLGLAGGVVIDVGQLKTRLPRNRQDVPGAVQFFRRTCFHSLGGILAIPEGGWDALTCAKARMMGFETRLLTELLVDHLKPRNIAEGGLLSRNWQMGVRDYALGYHPLFELTKCISRLRAPPFLISATARWTGYCYAAIHRRQRHIPSDLLLFLREEQKLRIFNSLRSLIRPKRLAVRPR